MKKLKEHMEIVSNELRYLSTFKTIEIRLLNGIEDNHQGYYDSIDDTIEALNELRKWYPQLSK